MERLSGPDSLTAEHLTYAHRSLFYYLCIRNGYSPFCGMSFCSRNNCSS